MFVSRIFGRVLYAAAKSESSAAAAAASASAKKLHNPLEEFFEVDRRTDDEKPVVYGISLILLLLNFEMSQKYFSLFFFSLVLRWASYFIYHGMGHSHSIWHTLSL